MIDIKKLKRLAADNLAEAKRLLDCLIGELEYESDKKDKKEIEKIRVRIKEID